MKNIHDQLDRSVTYNFPPKRIISLAPAITDTLYHLHLDKEIVGRTRFCIHPKNKVENALNVGGTKEIKMDKIELLHPDLIIVEKEENTKEIVQQLEKRFPVYVFEIQTVAAALTMINELGTITDRMNIASILHKKIITAMHNIPKMFQGKSVAYVIWKNPYMVVGKNTYINSLLKKLGFFNPFTSYDGRYPIVTEDDFRKEKLDYILLATEPFPFRPQHLADFTTISSTAQPVIVNGEMFWYGAKMLEAVTYFNEKFLR